MRHLLVLAVVLSSTNAAAQTPVAANPMATVLERGFNSISDFIVRSAEQFPEQEYGYRPTPDVRSFALEIGHVADAHYFFCSRARNEASPSQMKIEGNTLGKAELVTALKASVAYCKTAYAGVSDAALTEPFQAGQARGIKFAPLVNNVAHDNEHYGKIVTITRLKGLVPPSSQPSQ